MRKRGQAGRFGATTPNADPGGNGIRLPVEVSGAVLRQGSRPLLQLLSGLRRGHRSLYAERPDWTWSGPKLPLYVFLARVQNEFIKVECEPMNAPTIFAYWVLGSFVLAMFVSGREHGTSLFVFALILLIGVVGGMIHGLVQWNTQKKKNSQGKDSREGK